MPARDKTTGIQRNGPSPTSFTWDSMLEEAENRTLLPGVVDHEVRHCDGQPTCPLHDPTDHHMRKWPQFHGTSFRFTIRQCPHRVLHPDPDDVRWGSLLHGHHHCDGCCVPPAS